MNLLPEFSLERRVECSRIRLLNKKKLLCYQESYRLSESCKSSFFETKWASGAKIAAEWEIYYLLILHQ